MTIILVVVFGVFLRVFWELIDLHVFIPRSPDYRERKYDNTYELLGLRGRILDRNGVVLAESVSGREVAIDAQDPALENKKIDRDNLPIELAELLGVNQEKLIEAYASGRRYTKICTITDDALIHELQRRKDPSNTTNRIAGVSIATVRSVRSYPNGARLCHVLGFVNHDGEGVYGIEQRFNKELSGTNGMVHAVYDGRRREIRSRRIDEVQPEHGKDIYLTIDNNIQYIIENALSNALTKFQAESGTIIVQHVKTGEILGMATLPSFKPQEFNKHFQDEWKNIA
ncbi:MAG: hypothetical protein J6V91_01065, partial [Kiritimatiellae bacterium]|nr:hypothetical protein [Kiritimatiellia bacterium]